MRRHLAPWLIVMVVVALVLWHRAQLTQWIASNVAAAAPVQTFGKCPAPSEGEHLVVVIGRKGDQVMVDACFFAGSRGTYGSRRGPAAKGPQT